MLTFSSREFIAERAKQLQCLHEELDRGIEQLTAMVVGGLAIQKLLTDTVAIGTMCRLIRS